MDEDGRIIRRPVGFSRALARGFTDGLQREIDRTTAIARTVIPDYVPEPLQIPEANADHAAATRFIEERETLCLLRAVCARLKAPVQIVDHGGRTVTASEKGKKIFEEGWYYKSILEDMGQPLSPIVIVTTMLLSTPAGFVLFSGGARDSFSDHDDTIQAALGLTRDQRKQIRVAPENPLDIVGLEKGTVSPLVEPKYQPNIVRVFLVRKSFPPQAVAEIPINLAYGLMVNAFVLLKALEIWPDYPPITLL